MPERKGQLVGYLRVSTLDQNEQRQLEGIDLDRRFVDKASGKDTKRPQLVAMMAYVREGDVVAVHSLDRLARNLDDLRKLVLTLTQKGVRVKFVKENLEFSGDDSPMSHLLLSIMGAFAQFERDLIRERQREGIALAKQRGNVYKGGRGKALKPEQVEEMRRRVASGVPLTVASRDLGVTRQTAYRYLNAPKEAAAC